MRLPQTSCQMGEVTKTNHTQPRPSTRPGQVTQAWVEWSFLVPCLVCFISQVCYAFMFYFSCFIFMCAEAGITYTAHIVRFHPVKSTSGIHKSVMLEMLNLQPQETRTSLLLTQLSRFSTVRNLTLIFNCNINELIKNFRKIFLRNICLKFFFDFFWQNFFFNFFSTNFFFFSKIYFWKIFSKFFFRKKFLCENFFVPQKYFFSIFLRNFS